jgi:serine acetyltransferase
MIGEGATIGALSLVKSPIEPWTVNAGIPSRVIGQRDRNGTLASEQRLRQVDGTGSSF